MARTKAHTSPAARRYARALFLAAKEQGALEEVWRDVELIRHATSHPEVSGWLADPRVEDERKQTLLDREIGSRAHDLTKGLLKLITRRRRHAILPQLPVAFESLSDEHAGRLRGTVESSRPLSEAQRASLEQALAASTRKEVILEPVVDTALLGGVRVTLGGTRYDATVVAQVEQLRRSLSTADLGTA